MPAVILESATTRSPVTFIHAKLETVPKGQLANTFEIEDQPERPHVEVYQIARLYGNIETQEIWWEVETKPTLKPVEVLSMIPRSDRIKLRRAIRMEHDELLEDWWEMLILAEEVNTADTDFLEGVEHIEQNFGVKIFK